jgi:uncharacterized protein
MVKSSDILTQYRKLQNYCDKWSSGLIQKYPKDITCNKKCSNCCILNSVCLLEAYSIVRTQKKTHKPKTNKTCVFLKNDLCSIYKARPIICRTHGLPITSTFIKKRFLDCCPKNFITKKHSDIPPKDLFPLDTVNENLMRLNLAFCMLLGKKALAGKRFTLKQIAAGKVF